MKKVFDMFGIDEHSTTSIYKYSPVYKFKKESSCYILKRTKIHTERLESFFNWTEYLCRNSVHVVKPIPFEGKKSKFAEGENWVIYPFIEGAPYTATHKQIKEAGQFLGKIHGLGHETRLPYGHSWERIGEGFKSDAESDLKKIIETYSGLVPSKCFSKLSQMAEKVIDEYINELKKTDLPSVDSVWDYKDNNIVYSDNGIVLIDPDNAGNVPRIVDLALALVLFHMEEPGAPARAFNQEEWAVFKQGYESEIQLTEKEKEQWHKALCFVFVDEAFYAITDLDAKESKRQKNFIKSLISLQLEDYKL